MIPAGYCLPAVRLLAFCSSKPSAQRLSPCAAATGACALRRHLSGDLHPAPKNREPLLRVRSQDLPPQDPAPTRPPSRPAQEQKPSNGKPKGKHKIDSNQKPGGLRRKGPPFPSNSSTKLKDPWRISNPRKEEGGETRTARERERRATSSLAPGRGELAALLSLLTPLTL